MFQPRPSGCKKPAACLNLILFVKKTFPSACLLVLALSSSACSTNRTMTRTVGGAGELPPMTVTVRALPWCRVEVPGNFTVTGRMNSQGLVDLQVPVRNPSSSPRKFRYSWQWFGPDGLSTMDPAREVWRTGFLDGKDTTNVGCTSTVADPAGVVFRLSDSP